MVVLIQLPEIMTKSAFEHIVKVCPKLILDDEARVAVDKFSGEYKKLGKGDYFEDEVIKQDDNYILKDGTEVLSYDIFQRPKEEMVVLQKNFCLVDIESFASVAEGITFTIVEVYKL